MAAPECYERLGTYAQMNPPIREARHREALWKAVEEGLIDVIGSDHAPHTRDGKGQDLSRHAIGHAGRADAGDDPARSCQCRAAVRWSASSISPAPGAARIFGIAGKGRIARGYDADFTIVDLKAKKKIENSWIASRCGWTPFDGMETTGWAVATIIRGRTVMRDRALVAAGQGAPIRFVETLPQAPE